MRILEVVCSADIVMFAMTSNTALQLPLCSRLNDRPCGSKQKVAAFHCLIHGMQFAQISDSMKEDVHLILLRLFHFTKAAVHDLYALITISLTR